MSGKSSRLRRHLAAISAALVIAPVVAPAAPALAGDLAFGEYLSSECMTCHRIDGSEKGIPSIIGWPTDHFEAVMHSYRNRVRENPVMQTIAGRLSQAEIEALAAYLASLKTPP